MQVDERTNTIRIRELNDRFRNTFQGGRVMLTSGVRAMASLASILTAVKDFTDFSDDNDPHGEHDFGAVDIGGEKIFWKIDTYDTELAYGSPDPTDPAVTTRVLTIMRADEY